MTNAGERNDWDATLLRGLIGDALPTDTSLHGTVPSPQHVYLPASHMKALRPEATLVVGQRGAGKSFWWAALQNPQIRVLVSKLAPGVGVSEQTTVAQGFGETPNPDMYPDRDTLSSLLRQNVEPRLIWKTVMFFHVCGQEMPIAKKQRWVDRVAWVRDNPETVASLLFDYDKQLDDEKRWFVVLFDALDRSAGTWQHMYELIRGLLEVALEFRPYRRIRMKCFLRTDQLDETRVANFADASKVLASTVELSWPAADLYGLLWQYLGNSAHPGAELFRKMAAMYLGSAWNLVRLGDEHTHFRLYQTIQDDEDRRQLLHAITGPWMGRDRRRGFPYTWIPGRLSDAHGNTSPRVFLAALRHAAEDTAERYASHEKALHYESIKRGVQAASSIRVAELKEDYPWVNFLMEPLRGSVVPCAFDEIRHRWDEAQAIAELQLRADTEQYLLPAHLDSFPDDAIGARRDLEHLGIFYRLRDGRINVPDVFRVGYGLGRRGGVRPVRGLE